MAFVNQGETEIYLCGSCNNIAHNAMSLNCDSKYHEKQDTLFCSNCVSTDFTQNCPFNHHINPIFIPAIQQRLRMDELDIKCPYSAKEDIIAKKHDIIDDKENNDEEVFVFDTDHGNIASEIDHDDNEGIDIPLSPNINNSSPNSNSIETHIGCEWIGKYKQLWHHIDNQCKFVPVQHQIMRLKSQLKELQDIQRSTEYQQKQQWKRRKIWIIICFAIMCLLLCVLMVGFGLFGDRNWCNLNGNVDMDELRKYIDERLEDEYGKIEGYFEILKGDLMHDLSDKGYDFGDDRDRESKYEIIEDIMDNVKTTYDGVKEKIDNIPFVQFVSNTMDKFKVNKNEL